MGTKVHYRVVRDEAEVFDKDDWQATVVLESATMEAFSEQVPANAIFVWDDEDRWVVAKDELLVAGAVMKVIRSDGGQNTSAAQLVDEKMAVYKRETEERQKQEALRHHGTYRTANVIGKEILTTVTRLGKRKKNMFEKQLAGLDWKLLENLLADAEAKAAWIKLVERRSDTVEKLTELDVQKFYETLLQAILRLNPSSAKLFVLNTSESGILGKKPDLIVSTVPTKLPAYIVVTGSLKKKLADVGQLHEMVSQVDERMSLLLFPQQPERDQFFAFGGGAHAFELWAWKSGTYEYSATGLLALDWTRDSDALQAIVRMMCTPVGNLGVVTFSLPKIVTEQGAYLENVHRLDAGELPGSPTSAKSTTTVVEGNLNGELVVAKTSDQLEKELYALQTVAAHGVPNVVEVVCKGRDDKGNDWLILRPRGEALPLQPPKAVIQYMIDIGTTIGELGKVGWSQGDISYNNLQLFPGKRAGLIDFGASWQMAEGSSLLWPTVTPLFSCLEYLKRRRKSSGQGGVEHLADWQYTSYDLESLYYVFLFMATDRKLVWAPYRNEDREAYAVKFATMMDDWLFETDILSRVTEEILREAAVALRKVFGFGSGSQPRNNVTVEEFVAALQEIIEQG